MTTATECSNVAETSESTPLQSCHDLPPAEPAMNLIYYEFGSKHARTYEKTCECGRKIEVSTQKDECPEYYTEIHVRCVCGKSVAFELPVN